MTDVRNEEGQDIHLRIGGKQDVTIEKPRKLTVLVPDANTPKIEVTNPNVETITPEMTVAFADSMDEKVWPEVRTAPVFLECFKKIISDQEPPESLKNEGMGMKHIVGLIILSAIACSSGKIIHWKFPETYLHPKWQYGLSNLAAFMMNGGK